MLSLGLVLTFFPPLLNTHFCLLVVVNKAREDNTHFLFKDFICLFLERREGREKERERNISVREKHRSGALAP